MVQVTYKLFVNGMTEKHVIAACLSASSKAEALEFFRQVYGQEIANAKTWFVGR